MEFQVVISSNIRGIAYNKDTQELFVDFTSGSKYKYSGVPQEDYDDFLSAPSKGSFFHDNIRDTYPSTQV